MFNVVNNETNEVVASFKNKVEAEFACIIAAKNAFDKLSEEEKKGDMEEFGTIDWANIKADDDMIVMFFEVVKE